MRRKLRPGTVALLRRELDRACGAGALLAFAEAVVQQVSHPVGAEYTDPERERQVAAVVVEILLAACEGGATEAEAALLASHPALLSACFTNADLLHAGAGDAVALVIYAGVSSMVRSAGTFPEAGGSKS